VAHHLLEGIEARYADARYRWARNNGGPHVADRLTRSFTRSLPSAVSIVVALALALPAYAQTTFITQWGTAGNGNGQFNGPIGVATDASGNVFVADCQNNRIEKFRGDGTYLTQWGSLGAGPGQFNGPTGIATDAGGNVYVADTGNGRIQKFTGDGAYMAQLAHGTNPGQIHYPYGVATDLFGNVYVADMPASYSVPVKKFTADGTYLAGWGLQCCQDLAFPNQGPQYPGQLTWPFGIAVDAAGNVYVSDHDRGLIEKFSSDGTFVNQWSPAGLNQPYGLATDAAGNLHVGDEGEVRTFASSGTLLAVWGSYGNAPGQLGYVTGVAFDNGGNMYVSDPNNSRIEKFGFLPTPTKPMTWGHLKQLYR
jgi:DNA-binding beta-propeller fold protein YncE